MAKTAVADIIIPTEFEKYAIERTAELAQFGQCGIIESSPEFDVIAAGGGREVKMPFWKDLTATRQLLSDSATLTVNKITTDQDIARIHNDAQVWSVNHLAKVISAGLLEFEAARRDKRYSDPEVAVEAARQGMDRTAMILSLIHI